MPADNGCKRSSRAIGSSPDPAAADDALAVAPMLDALLLVVAEGQTERRDVLEVRHMLEAFNVIGTVLNKSVEKDSRRTSYYY